MALEQIPNEPGVYGAYNLTKQALYIGASRQLKKRCETHSSLLRSSDNGRGYFLGDSLDDVIFGVIELCTLEDLGKTELYYYDVFLNNYNLLNKKRPNGKTWGSSKVYYSLMSEIRENPPLVKVSRLDRGVLMSEIERRRCDLRIGQQELADMSGISESKYRELLKMDTSYIDSINEVLTKLEDYKNGR